MARSKRLEKKLKARETEWIERAESLYLKGEDEAFLASVRRRGGGVPAALAAAHTEVRQRVLRAALAAADLSRIETELGHGRVEGVVGALARAVLCSLTGAFDDAREALKEAQGQRDAEGLEVLLGGLRALIDTPSEPEEAELRDLPAPARTAIVSFRRLRQLELAAQGGRGTGRQPLDDPKLDAVRQMIDALVTMRHRNFSPGAASANKLVAACEHLAKVAPGSATVAAVTPRAQVLRAVVDAEKRVRASRGAAATRALGALDAVADEFSILGDAPPPAATAVHFALRRRSRSLLAAVAEAEGAEGLATLVAEMPALAAELTLDGRPLATGDPLLEARRLQDPWHRMSPSDFADRVARLTKGETDPLRIGQLIQIELDARLEAIHSFPGFVHDPERLARGLVERLHQVAHGLKRLPRGLAEEVAKTLRADLAELTLGSQMGLEWLRLAEAVLVYLPGDPLLLILAVAGAHAAGDAPGVERLQRAIEVVAEKGRPSKVDRRLLAILIEGLASETMATVGVSLAALRRLVPSDAWEELRPLAAEEIARNVLMELVTIEQEMGSTRDLDGTTLAEFLASRAADLAPLLGGEPGFDALRVTLACVDAGAADRILRVDGFLAQHGGYGAAVALYRNLMRLEEGFAVPPGLSQLGGRVAGRAVKAIEPGQSLEWLPDIMWLLPSLDDLGMASLTEAIEREQKITEDPKVVQLLRDLVVRLTEEHDLMSPAWYDEAEQAMPEPRKPRAPRPAKDQLKLF